MKTVLLIGKRARILDNLADLLRQDGFAVIQTDDLENLQNIDVSQVDAVAFGQALSSSQKQDLEKDYLKKNPALVFVHGLAPIPPLLVAQIKAALTKPAHDTTVAYDKTTHTVQVKFVKSSAVTVRAWWLTLFYNAKSLKLASETLRPGVHSFPIPAHLRNKKLFIVVTINDDTFII